MTAPARWLLCRRRRPEAKLRMYVFPHSGGSAGEYLRWSDALPTVEVQGVQLPGRGSRSTEPPLTGMAELVSAVTGAIDFASPYVLFGHSLGALVAYETALALRDAGRRGPERLFLSGYRAPHLHEPAVNPAGMSDKELLAAIEARHGELPWEVKADPEMLALTLSTQRADLTIVAGYRRSTPDPVGCPLTVLGGADDRESGERLAAWAPYTTAGLSVHEFPGRHFYFREQPEPFLRFLADRL